MTPACDLGDVLASSRPLADAILVGPHGVRILAGAHGTRTMADLLADAPRRLVAEMAAIEADTEFLLIDAGSGLDPSIAALAEAADGAVLVTTPEPTSIADAHAALKRLGGARSLRLAVNQARSRAEGAECLDRLAASSRHFLGLAATPLGAVRFDPLVARAVRSREPFVDGLPDLFGGPRRAPDGQGAAGLAGGENHANGPVRDARRPVGPASRGGVGRVKHAVRFAKQRRGPHAERDPDQSFEFAGPAAQADRAGDPIRRE